MVNTMARRTDGGVRFRPVGSRRSRTAPVYSPRGTGCPAIEQAVQGLYKGQNEESFWTLMSALNYALELETHVLVPLQTALSAQGAPAPWMEHPIPAEKAEWVTENDLSLDKCAGISGVRSENGRVVFEAASGVYKFRWER